MAEICEKIQFLSSIIKDAHNKLVPFFLRHGLHTPDRVLLVSLLLLRLACGCRRGYYRHWVLSVLSQLHPQSDQRQQQQQRR